MQTHPSSAQRALGFQVTYGLAVELTDSVTTCISTAIPRRSGGKVLLKRLLGRDSSSRTVFCLGTMNDSKVSVM